MRRLTTVFFLITFLVGGPAQSQHIFSSLDSLLNYATVKNISLQSYDIKVQKAKMAKLAAILNIPEVSGNVSVAYTNNTRLPVNLFPAETFGGQPGTYREVQTGVQYVTNFNENIDIKLFNLKGWENLKLSRLNIEATVSDKQLSIKALYDNIAATYFNIVNLQEQLLSAKQNVLAADTLLKISQQKYQQGIIKQQDVNDAEVGYINSKESASQFIFLIEQQYLALKILSDIPDADSIVISQKIYEVNDVMIPAAETSTLSVKNSLLKEKVAWSNYKQYKYSMYPTLSFFQSYTNQQYNTRGKLFDKNVNWIPSNYIGLKLSIPLPNASTIAQASNAKYEYLLAQKTTEQQKIKSGLEAKQLSVEYSKALSQSRSNAVVYRLRTDTYQKNLDLYEEGLISLDQTLTSFNEMVNSNYNLISSRINVLLAGAKIDINNKIK
jgi:outer membrane protein TolC